MTLCPACDLDDGDEDWDEEEGAVSRLFDLCLLPAITIFVSLAGLAAASVCAVIIVWCWRTLIELLPAI